MSDTQVKFLLGEQDIPTHWVNLMADLPGDAPPPPPLHPGTKEPVGPDDPLSVCPDPTPNRARRTEDRAQRRRHGSRHEGRLP